MWTTEVMYHVVVTDFNRMLFQSTLSMNTRRGFSLLVLYVDLPSLIGINHHHRPLTLINHGLLLTKNALVPISTRSLPKGIQASKAAFLASNFWDDSLLPKIVSLYHAVCIHFCAKLFS